MEKIKVYRHMKTNEIVLKEDAEEYAMDQLGVKITPKGKYGVYTQEQIDFMCEFTQWYFSDVWFEEELEKEENMWEV